MSNRLVKDKDKKKQKSLGELWGMIYGGIMLGCGIVFVLILLVIWQFPTNLDGTSTKIYITIGWIVVSLLMCALGGYWILAGKYSQRFQERIERELLKEAKKKFERNNK